jgi:predicted aminopeptidase
MNPRALITYGAVLLLTLALPGCGAFSYYSQAIGGHLDLMSRRVSIDQLIAASETPPALKRKLHLVTGARDFASDDLSLPENDSYRSYAELGREYAVWNVFAVPELSLKPVSSCFVWIGCLSYRGFFNVADAEAFANELRAAGHDVFVAGVAAYSTLGWFDDPVLNTMLVWDDNRIVEVIFHELAHQLLYADDDTAFNEGFATAVAQIGAERWDSRDPQIRKRYLKSDAREKEFYAMLLVYRGKLEGVFSNEETDSVKREAKSRLYSELLVRYNELKRSWNGYTGYDAWMSTDLNNAKIASVATYHEYVPVFRFILDTVDGNLERFYAIAKELAAMTPEQRERCFGLPGGESECLNEVLVGQ